jgi:hypothetical protein
LQQLQSFETTQPQQLPSEQYEETVCVGRVVISMMVEKRLYSIVTSAVTLIRSDTVYARRLMNCWLPPAETWVGSLQKFGNIDTSLTFLTIRQFNAAFSRLSLFGSVMSRFDGSNQSGIFRVSFQHSQ